MRHAVLALLLTLGACAGQQQWTHAHGDPARFEQDRKECMYEAAKAVGGASGFAAGYNEAMLGRQCMEVRGYKLERKP